MSERVLGTERALQAAVEFRAILTGDLRDRLLDLDRQGSILCRPGVWEGPDADRFRGSLWPPASGTIARVLAQLDRLAQRAERVTRDILVAGGDGAAAGSIIGPGGGSGGDDVPQPPPPSTSPGDVHRWWESLTPDRQAAEIAQNPQLIGSLDGIPAAARDAANREDLLREEQALEASGKDPGRLADLRALDAQLQDYDHSDPNNPDHPRPYLLGLDQKGHVVISVGNPDFADNVVTMVPGGTQLNNAPGQLKWARNVVTAARRADGTQTTAAILWQNYDSASSPNGFNAIDNQGPARDAGRPLNDFQQGLQVTHEQRPGGLPLHTILIGHSYGTVAVGDSSQQPGYRPPDDMIMTGAPGMGVGNSSDLHLPNPDGRSHLWVGAASNDPNATILSGLPWPFEGLGPNPTYADGAEDFTTAAQGHDGYYSDPTSTTMQNVGNIVVGNYDGVHTYQPVLEA